MARGMAMQEDEAWWKEGSGMRKSEASGRFRDMRHVAISEVVGTTERGWHKTTQGTGRGADGDERSVKKDQKQAHDDAELEKHALVLDDPYPTRPLAVTRAQPDVVFIREPDFQRAVGPQAGGVSKLPLQPVSQFGETRPGVLVGYCPLGRVLRILFAAAMRTQKHQSATRYLDT